MSSSDFVASGHSTEWSWDAFSRLMGEALAAVSEDLAGVELRPGDHILDDLGLDSIGVLLLVRELEDRLGVDCPPIEVEPTLANLYGLVTGLSNSLRPTADELGPVTIDVEPEQGVTDP